MNRITLIALSLIISGAVVMLISFFKFRRSTRLLRSISREEHGKLSFFFHFHQVLICFFFAGYLVVLYAIVIHSDLVGDLFVGLIFFFGAVFVLFGILLQNRMSLSVKNAYDNLLRSSETLKNEQTKLIREIKDRQETQIALQRSQSFLQHIIDAFPEPLMVINLDYSIALSNRCARKNAPSDLHSQQNFCYQASHHKAGPCDETEHPCPLQTVIREKTMVTVEHIHKSADGQPQVMEIIAAPIFNENHEVVQIIESFRDITHRKQMEEQVAHIHKMDAIGTLAGGIAHDFNNILSAIMGYTEMSLLEVPNDTRLSGKLLRILQASQRAKDLVNQILTFSRRKKIELKPVHLQRTILETVDLLRATIPSTIDFQQRLNAGNGVTMADPTQVHQVLMNLCTNAAHAMRETGGRLTISLEETDIVPKSNPTNPKPSVGPYLQLTVSDTGHGMDGKTLDRIFEPFFTTKEPGEGTGLGLSAVHGIIQNIGGAIKVESNPGEGTTFRVFFPRIEIDSTIASPENGITQGGKEHILLVDDERIVLDVTADMLRYFGYEVVSTHSPLEALDMFSRQPERFDLVMTDQTMPHMTGEKLTDALKRIRPDIPVILCTGYGDQIVRSNPNNQRFNGFLMKPVVMDDLAAAVRKVLDQSG